MNVSARVADPFDRTRELLCSEHYREIFGICGAAHAEAAANILRGDIDFVFVECM